MKKLLPVLLAAILFAAGCAGSQEDAKEPEEKQILADYFERTVGTPEEEPYYELVLYTYKDEGLLLEIYENGGTENETVKGYIVPESTYTHFLDIVSLYEMDQWNERDGTAITGALYVVRFRKDGKSFRVTSEHMPEDGMEAFREVYLALIEQVFETDAVYEYNTHDKED